MISKYSVFDNLKNIKYGGLRLNIAYFIYFQYIFSLLPLKNIKNKQVIN